MVPGTLKYESLISKLSIQMAYTKFSQDWLYKVLVSKKELKKLQSLRQMDDTQETDGNRSPTHLTRPSYIPYFKEQVFCINRK